MSVSTPGPEVDLIEHAAGIIVAEKKKPYTGPYHWAGALWQAGMLVSPGHSCVDQDEHRRIVNQLEDAREELILGRRRPWWWRLTGRKYEPTVEADDDYIGPGMRVSQENDAATVDQVARAIYDSAREDESTWTDWDLCGEEIRNHWRPYARAALAAMHAVAAR